MLKKVGWAGEGAGVRVVMNKELKLLLKLQKSEGGPVQGWGGGQSGCERRIEVIVKMQKKKKRKRLGWGPLWGGGGGVEELKLL